MIESLLAAQVQAAAQGPGLCIRGPEYDSLHPGPDQGSGAHGARLQAHVQGGVQKPVVAQGGGGFSHAQHLGVAVGSFRVDGLIVFRR